MAATVEAKTETKKGSRAKDWQFFEDNSSQFKFREDDTLILAHPKCGTHWANEIIRFLVAGTTDLPMEEKDDAMIEMQPMDHLEALPSPRVVNTHDLFQTIAPEFLQFKCKVFYITRDPRDVFVSNYFHSVNGSKGKMDTPVVEGTESAEAAGDEDEKKEYEDEEEREGRMTWAEYFNSKMERTGRRSWFDYTKTFEKGIEEHPENPILELVYETMKEEPFQEIKRMSEFLGLQHSEDFLHAVVEKTSFQSMKKQRASENGRLLYMYRKGEKGDWKNHFTVAQMEAFNEKFEAEMKGTKAYKRYTHTE